MPRLSHEETIALLLRAQNGDETAKAELVEGNMALVSSIARRFISRGAEYDDLMQTGAMGLIKAIASFDTTRGLRFSTYAVPLIMGEMQRMLRDFGPLHVSRTIKAQAAVLRQAQETLRNRGERAGIAEVAAVAGISVEEAAFVMESGIAPRSLDEQVSGADGERTLKETIAGKGDAVSADERIALKEMLRKLAPRERQIILLRYFKEWQQVKVADALGISQVQVSRLEKRILDKLRKEAQG